MQSCLVRELGPDMNVSRLGKSELSVASFFPGVFLRLFCGQRSREDVIFPLSARLKQAYYVFPPQCSLACYRLPDVPVVQMEGVEVGIRINPVFIPAVPLYVELRVSC